MWGPSLHVRLHAHVHTVILTHTNTYTEVGGLNSFSIGNYVCLFVVFAFKCAKWQK